MSKFKRLLKKLLCFTLSVAMLNMGSYYSLIPGTKAEVHAKSNSTNSEGNILDQLNLPDDLEGVDYENKTPFGKKTVDLFPIRELYVRTEEEGRLYFHDGNNNPHLGDSSYVGNAKKTIAMAEALSLDGEKEDKVAVIHCDKTTGQVFLTIIDPLYNDKLSTIEVQSLNFSIDSPYLSVIPFLHITAGDYNGDGKDEIAIYNGEGISIFSANDDDYELEITNTITFDESNVYHKDITINTADVTYDGIEDVVVTYTSNYVSKVGFYEGTAIGLSNDYFEVDTKKVINKASTDFQDLDLDGKKELVVGGVFENDKDDYLYLEVFQYNPLNDEVKSVFVDEIANHVSSKFDDLAISLALPRFEHDKRYIYMESAIYTITDGELALVQELGLLSNYRKIAAGSVSFNELVGNKEMLLVEILVPSQNTFTPAIMQIGEVDLLESETLIQSKVASSQSLSYVVQSDTIDELGTVYNSDVDEELSKVSEEIKIDDELTEELGESAVEEEATEEIKKSEGNKEVTEVVKDFEDEEKVVEIPEVVGEAEINGESTEEVDESIAIEKATEEVGEYESDEQVLEETEVDEEKVIEMTEESEGDKEATEEAEDFEANGEVAEVLEKVEVDKEATEVLKDFEDEGKVAEIPEVVRESEINGESTEEVDDSTAIKKATEEVEKYESDKKVLEETEVDEEKVIQAMEESKVDKEAAEEVGDSTAMEKATEEVEEVIEDLKTEKVEEIEKDKSVVEVVGSEVLGKSIIITEELGKEKEKDKEIEYSNTMMLALADSSDDSQFVMRELGGGIVYFALPNTDIDTVQINLVEKPQFSYSDPEILAAIASAPYFEDLTHLDGGDDYLGNTSTSFASIKGTGTTESTHHTITAGAYVSYSHDFEAPLTGIKIANFETELEITGNFTFDTETTKSKTTEVEYSVDAGEDAVALFITPKVVYNYEMKVPYRNNEGNYEYKIEKMDVTVPYTSEIRVISVNDYESIRTSDMPQIKDKIFNHEIGNPYSYPTSSEHYNKVIVPEGNQQGNLGVGYGNTSLSQTVEITEELSDIYEWNVAVSGRVGGGPGSLTLGVVAGTENGSGSTEINLTGHAFSTDLASMPEEAKKYGYQYAVGLFQYKYMYEDGEESKSFPVVNYTVSNVQSPEKIPNKIATSSTDDTINLSWNYDAGISSYRIYRVYNQDGNEISFLQEEIVCTGVETVINYVDTELTEKMVYAYKIQTVNGAGVESVLGPSIKVTTKPSINEDSISITVIGSKVKREKDTYFAGKVVRLESNFIENGFSGVQYQWQKKYGDTWENINNGNVDKLNLEFPSISDSGLYRVIITVLIDQKDVYTYESEIVELKFIKGHVDINYQIRDDEIFYYIYGQSNAYKPTGLLTLEVDGVNTKKTMTTKFDENGSASFSIKDLKGLYDLNAYYHGDRGNDDKLIKDTRLINLDTSYGIEVHNMIYGQCSEPKVYKYSMTAEKELIEKANLTYEVYTKYKKPFLWFFKITAYRWEKFNYKDSFPAGQYRVRTSIEGTELSEDFSVSQRKLNVYTNGRIVSKQLITEDFLRNIMPTCRDMKTGDTLTDIDFIVEYYKENGERIGTIKEAIETLKIPGRYIIKIKLKDKQILDNYRFNISESFIQVLPRMLDMECEAKEYNNFVAGTVSYTSSIKPDKYTGLFYTNTEITYKANPYKGYTVDKWEVYSYGKVIEEYTPLEDDDVYYQYTLNDENIKVVVHFKVKENKVDFYPQGQGSVSCITQGLENITKDTTIVENTPLSFKAVPEKGYHFVHWIYKSDSEYIYDGIMDEDGSNTLSFKMPDASVNLKAVFERDSYSVTYSQGLNAYMEVESGEIPIQSGAKVRGDSKIRFEAVKGMIIKEGSFKVNNQVASLLELLVTEDITVEAELEAGSYSFSYSIQEPTNVNNVVKVMVNSLPIELEENQTHTVQGGTRVELLAEPERGFVFKEWLGIPVELQTPDNLTDAHLIIPNLGDNVIIKAVFEKDINFYTLILDHSKHGKCTIYADGNQLEVIDKKVAIFHGEQIKIISQGDVSYMVEQWVINNKVHNPMESYTFNASKDMNIFIRFTPMVYFNVSYAKPTEGAMLLKVDDEVAEQGKVGGGSVLEFNFTPDSGKMLDYWLVNGKKQLNEYNVPLLSKSLQISSLLEDTDVEVVVVNEKTYEILPSAESSQNAVVSIVVDPDDYQATGDNNYKVRKGARVELQVESTDPDLYAISEIIINGTNMAVNNDNKIVINQLNNNLEYTIKTAKRHDVTHEAVNGSCVTPEVKYTKDSIVIVEAYADEGYVFSHWTSEPVVSFVNANDAITEFTMIDEPVKLIPVFELKKYSLTAESSTGGNMTISLQEAKPGIAVTVEAVPSQGYEFLRWESTPQVQFTNSNHIKTSFTMPAHNVRIKAVFKSKIPVIPPNPGGGSGGGSGGGGGVGNTSDSPGEQNTKSIEQEFKEAMKNTQVQPNGAEEISIDLPKAKDNTYECTLPKDFTNSKKEQVLTLKTPIGEVSIPSMPGKANKDIDILVKKEANGKGIHIEFTKNSKPYFWQAPIKITLPIGKKDNDEHKTVVVRVDEKGREQVLPMCFVIGKDNEITVEAKGNGTYTTKVIDKSFNDLESESDTSKVAIEGLAARGVIHGVTTETFSPEGNVKRGDFVLLLRNVLGDMVDDEARSHNFTDVNPTDYYADAISWANQNNIIAGTGAGLFSPGESITREDMLTIVHRMIETMNLNTSDKEKNLKAFLDHDSISNYAKDAIYNLDLMGISLENTEENLGPKEQAKRRDVAVILYGLLQNLYER